MAQKRRQYLKTQTGLEKQLFESSADIVELDPIEGMTSTNVQDAIAELQNIAAQGGVTSVNGKTGAVTLVKADVGLGNVDNTSDANKPISTATQTALDKKANTADLGTLAFKDSLSKTDVGLGNVTNDAQVKRSEMGVANGVATLDAQGKVPSAQLPSYVDDVLEYDNLAAFPATGEAGKIYVAKDTNKTYRWGGTAYVEISPSLALGETSSTAYAGDKGKQNADNIADIQISVSELQENVTQINTKLPNYVDLNTVQTITASKAFKRPIALLDDLSRMWMIQNVGGTDRMLEVVSPDGNVQSFQDKEGIVALLSDINDLISKLDDGSLSVKIAELATKLNTARTISLTGDATGSAQFDGSANAAIAVSLKNSGVVAGTYSVVQVDAKGIVTAGNQLVEWGVSGQTEPSANLAIGGIFFELIE